MVIKRDGCSWQHGRQGQREAMVLVSVMGGFKSRKTAKKIVRQTVGYRFDIIVF